MVVILNIVFVIGRRYKKRVKIYTLYSESGKIIKLLHNAFKISAVKFPDTHRCRIFVPIGYMIDIISDIRIFTVNNIIGCITVKKSVRVYLIYNGSSHPFRCLESRIYHKIIILVQVCICSQLCIKHRRLTGTYLEIIINRFFSDMNGRCIIIESVIAMCLLHMTERTVNNNINRFHIILKRAEP